MRTIVAILLAIFAQFSAFGQAKLLVLVDPYARGLAGDVLTKVLRKIETQETNFPGGVRVREMPRWSGNLTNQDWVALNRMAYEVSIYNPTTLWIIGHLPWLVTGGHNGDGHETRCIMTDQWLAVSDFAFVDTLDWGMTGYSPDSYPLNRNIPGDGRPDAVSGTFIRRVCRVDFAGLTRPSDDTEWSGGCLDQLPKQPAIDEGLALRQYFTNNLAYRNGEWTTSATGTMTGSLWALDYSAYWFPVTNANPSITWTKSSAAIGGGTPRFLYDNWDANEVANLYDGSCNGVRTVVEVTLRSYAGEVYRNYNVPARRLQPGRRSYGYTLTYCWQPLGATYWICPASAKTVGDMIEYSATNAGGVLFSHTILGDPTLPLVPQSNGTGGSLSVTNLVIQ